MREIADFFFLSLPHFRFFADHYYAFSSFSIIVTPFPPFIAAFAFDDYYFHMLLIVCFFFIFIIFC